MIRCCFFLTLLLPVVARTQVIKGVFELPLPAQIVVLYATTGSDHPPIDSVRIADNGAFAFTQRTYPAGFYQIGINGDDRIDLVVDPDDPLIELAFHGTPLQRNVTILHSADNQRMWAYKLISRAGQDEMQAIQNERANAAPLDTALLRRLALHETLTRQRMRHALDSLSAVAPDGQFARAVQVDRKLDAALREGPMAIRQAFDFADPWTLRSNAYAKATVAYLQATPFGDEYALLRACDTLLLAAGPDTACWRYMRHQLVDIFATYGPDEVAQYLVDTYVVGAGARVPPETKLLGMAASQLRMVLGAQAPDAPVMSPFGNDTTMLSTIWTKHAFTALFFYSSTCDHCHHQMPGLRELAMKMNPEFFQLVGIALDATEEEFKATIDAERIHWPCYSTLKGWGEPAAKAYNVKATPSMVVINRMGRIVAKPMNHQELRTFLETEGKK